MAAVGRDQEGGGKCRDCGGLRSGCELFDGQYRFREG